MTLRFITGNKNKLREAREILGNVENIELDLLEIQELDSKKIIEEKLREATKHQEGAFFCEDTSLVFNALGRLPGPFIKWMLAELGVEGLWKLLDGFEDKSAVARTMVGYTDGKTMKFFEGVVKGTIVNPRGEARFGWDPLFEPQGYEKTFAEMTPQEKNALSMRKKALIKLKSYLDYEN